MVERSTTAEYTFRLPTALRSVTDGLFSLSIEAPQASTGTRLVGLPRT